MVVLRLRRHARRLTLPVLALLAIVGAAGFWVGRLPEEWMNLLAAGGAALLALLLGVVPILSWLSTRATVTTRRVIVRRGFLVHHRGELPLSRVREVRSRRGPIQRMFSSGDVELVSGVEAPVVLRDVPGVQTVVEAMQELVQHSYARETLPGSTLMPPAVPSAPPMPFGR